MAIDPVTFSRTLATASLRLRPDSSPSSIMCGMTSVSVLDENLCPLATSSSLSCMKFSRTPLWATATVSVQSVCGCAFSLQGAPWVAHRVWPIPTFPVSPCVPRPAMKSEILPFSFRTSTLPLLITA